MSHIVFCWTLLIIGVVAMGILIYLDERKPHRAASIYQQRKAKRTKGERSGLFLTLAAALASLSLVAMTATSVAFIVKELI